MTPVLVTGRGDHGGHRSGGGADGSKTLVTTLRRKRRGLLSGGEDDDDRPLRRHRHRTRRPPREHFVVEVVYEDPTDALQEAPPRRLVPERNGDVVGDALFFGDDIMFGAWGQRERLDVPWPERARAQLFNAGLRLVVDALPRRTTRWDDDSLAAEFGADLCSPSLTNGLYELQATFSSHLPLLLVLALGTNDLRRASRDAARRAITADPHFLRCAMNESLDNEDEGFDVTRLKFAMGFTELIALSVVSLVARARLLFSGHCHAGALRIVVVAPPPLRVTPESAKLGFDDTSVQIQSELAATLRAEGRIHDFVVVGLDKVVDPQSLHHGLYLGDAESDRVVDAFWEAVAAFLPRRSKRTRVVVATT